MATAITRTGGSGDDVLHGGDGDDALYGNAGYDALYGGAGHDMLYGGSQGDTLQGGSGSDFMDGGDGIDWADFSDLSHGVTVDLFRRTAIAGPDADTLISIENAAGTPYRDVFIGDGLNNVFDGGDGDDVMVASHGNDIFRGQAGIDTVDYGGFGDLSGNPVAVTVDLDRNEATATMSHAGTTYTKSDYVDAENATGSATNDTLIGDEFGNVLDGGRGDDLMDGGMGDDTYIVDSYGDRVIERPDAWFSFGFLDYGMDTVVTALQRYSLADNVENLVGTATTGQVLTGNGENNLISAGSGDDLLDGGAGDDVLVGGLGNDRHVYGRGSGADVISGFARGDTISLAGFEIGSFERAMAFAREEMGNTIFDFGGGQTLTLQGVRKDSLVARDLGFAETLPEPEPEPEPSPVTIMGTEGRDVIDATRAPLGQVRPSDAADIILGLAGNDVIAGLRGNDVIDGGAGRDWIDAGDGDDTIVIAGRDAKTDVFTGGSGTDTVRVAGTDVVTLSDFDAAASSIEIWAGNGAAVRADARDNVFDFSALARVEGLAFVNGGGGNDTLTGSRAADTLRGGNGSDVLNGGHGGNDVLTGGGGADTFVFSRGFGHDRVTDFTATGDGHDVIQFDRGFFADFDAVMAAATQVGNAVVIAYDADHSVKLAKTTLSALSADDFTFV